MCDFRTAAPPQIRAACTPALPIHQDPTPATLLRPPPYATKPASASLPPSTLTSHWKIQTLPNSAGRPVSSSSGPIFREPFFQGFGQPRRLSRTNAAAPQSSNAAPSKSRPPLQDKSPSPTAATPQLFSPPHSLQQAPPSATKTDSQSGHAPPAAPESVSLAPQYKP